MALYARLWTDILADPKLMKAARNGAKNLEILPWLIVFAKNSDDSGRISIGGMPADARDISDLIPCVTPRNVQRCLDDLEKIGVIVTDPDGVKRLASWEHRSGKPSDGKEKVAERVRKHREKKRVHQLALSNAPVTVTGNATELEQEQEIKQEQKQEEGSNAPNKPEVRRDVVTTANFAALSNRLGTDLDRDALTALANSVPEPASWIAEARASLDGMHGPPLSPKQLGEALREYVGNGNLRTPNFKHFRRYLENAGKTPETANGPRRAVESGNGRSPDTGEAMTILTRIKALREVSTPQAGGQVERIRLSAVEEMGADVVSAFKSVGGADAILKSDPSRWGFLVRDFAVALNYARANPGGSMDG